MKDLHSFILWLAMMLLTLLSYSVASIGFEGSVFVAYLLLGAFIKGQIIIDWFMKLKSSGLLWRLLASIWLLLVLSTIALLYGLRG